MSIRLSTLMIAVLAAGTAVLGAAAPEPRPPSVRIQYTQLDWLGPQGEVLMDCSPVLEAEFVLRHRNDFLLGDEAGEGGAWINVVTWVPEAFEPEQWSVRNLHLSYPDLKYLQGSSPTVQFGLALEPGTCLTTLDHAVFVTPLPLPELPLSFELEPAKVGDDDYLAGGRISPDGSWWGGTGWSDLTSVLGPWGWWPPLPPDPPLPPPMPVGVRWSTKPVKGIHAVAELIDGCAPAAATRSLRYLMENAGEKPPHPTQMYNDLINEMGTVVGGQDDGGTSDDGIEAGKDSYANHHDVPVNTSRAYGAPSFGQAFNSLGNGGDVELLIGWSGGGGHCAMVTSMTQYADGSYDITYVDDPDQSDGRAENQEHTIHVDSNGNFPGGTVDGFVMEEHQ